MSRRRRKKLPQEPVEATIESLSHEGRGITHIEGKTVFVDGALPAETITFRYRRGHSRFDEASIETLLSEASPQRVTAKCEHFLMCGGCSLQHLHSDAQIEHKEAVLKEQLKHIGGVDLEKVIPALTGPLWGYRHKARLGVKHVMQKEKVLVGFREKYSSYVADISSCEVLHPKVGKILEELAALIANLSVYNKIAQIEVAVSEGRAALIFRNLAALESEDVKKLYLFSQQHILDIYLQPGGPDTVVPLTGEDYAPLSYQVDDGAITLEFAPTDFTQVNVEVNQKMVGRVIDILDIKEEDHILDLFCGLGNFTLPIARRAGKVMGIEGDQNLVEKARHNANLNSLENVQFSAVDLYQDELKGDAIAGDFSKILLDPPRSGAQAVIEQLDLSGVIKIVYVSCNPATLARDTAILIGEKGFKLVSAGVMDMFPHTTHVESIAVFEK